MENVTQWYIYKHKTSVGIKAYFESLIGKFLKCGSFGDENPIFPKMYSDRNQPWDIL